MSRGPHGPSPLVGDCRDDEMAGIGEEISENPGPDGQRLRHGTSTDHRLTSQDER